MADTRTYIRVHDGMPDHPKVDGLGDKAFRLLVTLWCWCSRHTTDGVIPAATWKRRGAPATRKELVAAGLVEELPSGGVRMHDYLEHQRSAEEIAEAKAAKSRGGTWGNHKRWHLDEGIHRPECEHCAIAPPITEPIPGVIAPPIANGSQNGRSGIASTSTDTEDKPSGAEPPVDVTVVSQSARELEAINWLKSGYGLTDPEAIVVWSTAKGHAKGGQVVYPLPFLTRLRDRGQLADIVKTVLDEADRWRPRAPEPLAEDAPPPPEPSPPTDPEPDDEPPMPGEKARAQVHTAACKTLRCPRCATLRERWPDLRSSP